MMIQKNKQVINKIKLDKLAFTLIELIVVITILAILGTIAFMSLQGYSKQARDSRRIADITNIKISLELFSIDKGYYPEPDNVGTAYYSGETVFTQGTVGDNVTANLSKTLTKKPTDPLLGTEYVYSTTVSKKEYELMSIFEGNVAFVSQLPNLPHPSPLLKERELSGISPLPSGEGLGVRSSYASNIYQVKVDGTYNKIFTQTTNYIVPIPSIITSEELPLNLEDGYKINSMVTNGGSNMPDLGISSIETQTGGLSMTLSVTGVIDKNSTDAEKISVIEAIQAAYDGSDLAGEVIYQNLLSQTSDEDKLDIVGYIVLNESAGGSTETVETLGCTTNPGYSNATYTEGEATEVDQVWQNTDSGAACYYECNLGYIGNDCNTEVTDPESEYFNWEDLYVDGVGCTDGVCKIEGTNYLVNQSYRQNNITRSSSNSYCDGFGGNRSLAPSQAILIEIYNNKNKIFTDGSPVTAWIGTRYVSCNGDNDYRSANNVTITACTSMYTTWTDVGAICTMSY